MFKAALAIGCVCVILVATATLQKLYLQQIQDRG